MNIRNLRIFKTICQCGSFTEAAVQLYMTQPAISHAVKDLERETGFSLFERLGRRVHITEAGKVLLDKTLHLLEIYDDLEQNATSFLAQASFRIGSCITIACAWLPDIMRRYRSLCDTPLQVTVDSAENILRMLDAHEIDMALYEGTVPHKPFASIPFSSYELMPICGMGHPFRRMSSVSVAALLREPLLLREAGSAVRDTLDGYLRLQGYSARPFYESVNTQAILQAVKAGMGISVLPDATVADAVAHGEVHPFCVEDMKLVNQNWIVYHEGKSISSARDAILESVRACCTE